MRLLATYKEQTDREHDEVMALGGLHILGTERHESRRIDNQLRGRAGRQGDPGSSRFYLSLQDDLMRIFGGERMQRLMLRLGMEEDVPIESKLITKRIAGSPGSRRSAELRSPQTPARIRRREQQAAPGRLRHAPRSCSKAATRKSASWIWCAAWCSNFAIDSAARRSRTPTPGIWPA